MVGASLFDGYVWAEIKHLHNLRPHPPLMAIVTYRMLFVPIMQYGSVTMYNMIEQSLMRKEGMPLVVQRMV